MHDIHLAFLWHQHQPYYPDDASGENPMPWVRLHASKDYWGMAMHLKEVPEMRAVVNLVPSLLQQLRRYTDEGHEDTHLRVSRAPADALGADDMRYLLDNFFMVNPDQMIRPYPRYQELYLQRGLGIDSADKAARRFTKRDILDLQCWSNLTWMHPIAFELDSDLAAFRKKGRGWSEKEKVWLLEKQLELLREVVPLHKELADRGQIELTTTPFYHPIMPLLVDRRLAREAMPHVNLPELLDPYPEDAAEHVRRAVRYHTEVFGQPPRGMWPSEGSVAQALVSTLAAAGIRWIATDEEILMRSTDGWISRDPQGFLRHPEMLYRPWRVEDKGHELQIVFRDHAMSDQIGFHYQRTSAAQAVDDFIGKLEAIGRATSGSPRPPLVSIILDGENCWEYYPNGGVDFLRTLYGRVARHAKIRSTTIGDHLERHPAGDKIGRLFAGSWIQHNFAIWLGHPECNRAWDLVTRTRRHLQAAVAGGQKTPPQLARAWEELYIAEGSDWFWWFGDSHSSAQDNVFDRLFRKHLQNVYEALGDSVPPDLLEPIRKSSPREARSYQEPTGLLNVKINGRHTYFEWLNAGHLSCNNGSRGTMSMVTQARLSDVYFGFDVERLLLRLDARGGGVREQLADLDSLRIVFFEPAGYELIVGRPFSASPMIQLFHHDVPVSESGVRLAAEAIFELSIPWRSLAMAKEQRVRFFLDLAAGDRSVERVPSEGVIETIVPSPDYERMMWQV